MCVLLTISWGQNTLYPRRYNISVADGFLYTAKETGQSRVIWKEQE